MKPEKFQLVAQESVAVRAYSVGCLYHSCYKGFLRTSSERVDIISATLHNLFKCPIKALRGLFSTMKELLKSRFLSLYCMVMADGVVEAKELETLYRIGREYYHLTPEEINQNVVSAGTSFVAPDKVEDRISILYEMAEIAWADGKIDETEKSLLARYAVRLGFMEENAISIAEFMLQQVKDGVPQEEVIYQIINA